MISTAQMRELEDSSGIPKITLMENAGNAIVTALKDKYETKNKRFLIVAYHGNNGGDGFVVARLLSSEAEVDLIFVGDEEKFKEEAKINYKKLAAIDTIQMLPVEAVDFSDYDYIIDAIFGIGIKRDIKDPLATLIKKLSSAKAEKISIDVPTGVDADTGEKSNVHFEPDFLITLHNMKKGLESYKDKTVIADIGISKNQ